MSLPPLYLSLSCNYGRRSCLLQLRSGNSSSIIKMSATEIDKCTKRLLQGQNLPVLQNGCRHDHTENVSRCQLRRQVLSENRVVVDPLYNVRVKVLGTRTYLVFGPWLLDKPVICLRVPDSFPQTNNTTTVPSTSQPTTRNAMCVCVKGEWNACAKKQQKCCVYLHSRQP